MDYSEKEFKDGKGYKRHGSPAFYKLLGEMADLHSRKSHDYANDSAPYGNYEFAGFVSSMFAHSPADAGFAGRLAEKLYRLSVLESGGKTPLNESIVDTERDIAVITALWMASRIERRQVFGGWPATADNAVNAIKSEPQYDQSEKVIDSTIKDRIKREIEYSKIKSSAFENDLRRVLNRHSRENISNTPDFILANYLMACLEAFDEASKVRKSWHSPDSPSERSTR